MAKKAYCFIFPAIATAAVCIALFFPILLLPVTLACGIFAAIASYIDSTGTWASVIALLAATGIGFMLIRDIFLAVILTFPGFITGIIIGCALRHGNRLKDIIITTLAVFSVVVFCVTVAFTYTTTGSFDIMSAVKPLFESVKEPLNQAVEIYMTGTGVKDLTDGKISQMTQAIYNTFVSSLPAILVILVLAVTVAVFWITRSVLSNKFGADLSYLGKFADTHLARPFFLIYLVVFIGSVALPTGLAATAAINFYLIGYFLFAYTGLAFMAFFLDRRKRPFPTTKSLITFFIIFSIICPLGISILSLIGLIADSALNLRKKMTNREE